MPTANELHNRITGIDAIHEITWRGATDPAADPLNDVQPHQLWIDETGGTTLDGGAILKERNTGNTAWTTRLDLATALAARQPLDSDLTAIAALTTTAFGRAFLALADAAAARTAIAAVIGTDVQAYNANLAAIAGLVLAANKIIHATGVGAVDMLDFSVDGTFAANSDTKIPSEKAIKTFVQALVTGGASGVMLFKGVIDCSANPNYPAANAGDLYKVSVAGKIGGGAGPNVEAGDTLYCITNGSASGNHATVGANWDIAQVNLDGAVIGPTAVTDSRIALFDGTTGKLIKDGGKLLTDLINNTLLTTLGDIIYASAANTPARLAGNTTTTRKWLRSTGAAGVATAPAYDVIVENDVGASTNNAGNTGAAITIDWSLGRTQKVTATANATITHSSMVAGVEYTLEYLTGAGAFTATFASTNWSGTAPTLTLTASKLDVFTFYKTIDSTILGGVFGQSFTP